MKQMQTSPPVVQLSNITVAFGSSVALENVTLSIKAGEFWGLIGPNGSGKSTLLKTMVGLQKPDHGQVELFGQPLSEFKAWSRVGYVPQRVGTTLTQVPVTVAEVVGMAATNSREVASALAEVSMEKHAERLLRDLSGGQQQRVFIARALVTKPDLLVLDEPTVGIDTESQTQFYTLLKKLNVDRGLTILLVSHDVDVVAEEVTHIACLNRELLSHGSPKTVLKSDALKKIYGDHVQFVVHGH